MVLVLTFGPGEREQRRTVLRPHAVAYANRRAAPADRVAWELAAPIEYEAERERLHAYWDRQPGDADTGDFER